MAGERLVEIMQAAALGAAENAVMANLLFGEVVSQDPIAVRIDDRFELGANFLVIPKHLTDYETTIEMMQDSAATDAALEGQYRHSHSYEKYTALKDCIVKNSLKKGEKVALLRAMGGQKFYILDRVG